MDSDRFLVDSAIRDSYESAFDFLDRTNKNIFVTGKAGTGKSTLLQIFRSSTQKNCVILAPTGVAAVNVKGQTIHSFFRFKTDVTLDSVAKMRVPKSRRRLYEGLDTIVIDEISMVRSDMLDCIELFLRLNGKVKSAPFGGVQIIFFGDLYQLPPVVMRHERALFNGPYNSCYFFDAKCYADLNLQCFELEEVHRQKEDIFLELLNAVRNKNMMRHHFDVLKSRYQPHFFPDKDDFYVYLTTTNAMADKVNSEQLEQITRAEHAFEGDITGDFESKYLPAQLSFKCKVGAQVMLLNNDAHKRWVNGSIAKVISCSSDEDGEGSIKVELADGREVDVHPFTWEMFQFKYNEDSERIESDCIGAFTQFPLRLAWAVTIHKSQGKTFDRVIVDVGNGAFAHGQIYVALSRCTTFEGLILRKPIRLRDIHLDQKVVHFMGQMKNNKLLVLNDKTV